MSRTVVISAGFFKLLKLFVYWALILMQTNTTSHSTQKMKLFPWCSSCRWVSVTVQID